MWRAARCRWKLHGHVSELMEKNLSLPVMLTSALWGGQSRGSLLFYGSGHGHLERLSDSLRVTALMSDGSEAGNTDASLGIEIPDHQGMRSCPSPFPHSLAHILLPQGCCEETAGPLRGCWPKRMAQNPTQVLALRFNP